MFQGVTINGYFTEKGCDPLASGEVPNINQLIPFTVMELFDSVPGLPGLFIAALAAASLSTLSSGLSSLAAVTYEDILKTFFPNLNEEKATNISKIVVVIYGVIAVAIAFLLLQIVQWGKSSFHSWAPLLAQQLDYFYFPFSTAGPR